MNTITLNLNPITEAAKNFPWHDKETYAEFLAQTYYFVCHSTRLLAFAAGMIKPGDRKAFDRYIKHIGEERNHELLAKHDIEALGYKLEAIAEMPSTRLLWEPQYYKVMHKSPLSLLGYIVVLEALAANEVGDIIQLIASTHGKECLNFIDLHAKEDIKHVMDAVALIDTLDDTDRAHVNENIEQTIWLYAQWLNAIADKVSRRRELKMRG